MAESSHIVFRPSTPFVLAAATQSANNGAMNFAANLKRLRLAAKMSQEQLAHACGYPHQSRIGNYESPSPKARQPRPDELPNIAKALGVSVAELLADFPDESGTAAPSRSHHERLDPEIVSDAHEALAKMYARAKRTYPEEDVARFVHIYEKFAQRRAGVPEAEILGAGLSDFTVTGGVGERAKGVPDDGGDKGNLARRIQHKA
jgi:transcriptional regulator with XRE-family HTH domain